MGSCFWLGLLVLRKGNGERDRGYRKEKEYVYVGREKMLSEGEKRLKMFGLFREEFFGEGKLESLEWRVWCVSYVL